MSIRFRIDTLTLLTDRGDVVHRFEGPLTVLSGPVGVGKTSLLELLKFALGGRGRISPVARDHVLGVKVAVSIEGQTLTLERNLVGDLNTISCDSDAPDLRGIYSASKTGDRESVGEMLLRSMGLPPQPTYSTKTRTSHITFNHVWWYVYVEQRDIDRSIAHSSEPYAEPARKAVFDLLFGLVTPDEMQIRARAQALSTESAEAHKHEATVKRFLTDSQSDSYEGARAAYRSASERLSESRQVLERLRTEALQSQVNVDVVREMVLKERENTAILERDLESLRARRQRQTRLLDSYQSKALLSVRSTVASNLLAPIDFVVCPRCAQSIKGRTIERGHCTLCLQAEPEVSELQARRAEAELSSTSAQEQEMRALIRELDRALVEREGSASAAKRNLLKLERLLDERTQSFISPRLEAFADASAAEAKSQAELAALEPVLRQWDVVRDLERKTLEVDRAIRSDTDRLLELEAASESRRREILFDVDREFRRLVGRLAIPTVTETEINTKNYLPYVNGTRWDHVSTGGIATAVSCAYWVSLLSVGLRRSETYYPGLLILDTPRKSIGSQNLKIMEQLYRELDILAASYPDRVQVVVADNDIPTSISKIWQDVRFDYQNPTVSTIDHPGEARVSTLEAVPEDWVAIGRE